MDDNVIDLFSRQPVTVPAAEESDFVSDFQENRLPEFMSSVMGMCEAVSEDDFRAFMAEVRDHVEEWFR